MTKKTDKSSTAKMPIFDQDVPIPAKGRVQFQDPNRSYFIGQEQFSISFALSCMKVGESGLMSNWATTSINYIQKKLGYRFQRESQVDGSVRVWRIK
jgi:hypothetical protein